MKNQLLVKKYTQGLVGALEPIALTRGHFLLADPDAA